MDLILESSILVKDGFEKKNATHYIIMMNLNPWHAFNEILGQTRK